MSFKTRNISRATITENTDGRYEIVKEGDRIAQLILERVSESYFLNCYI